MKTMTELQQVVEDMRVAQLHLSVVLNMALPLVMDAGEVEAESLVAAAIKFCRDDFLLWEKLECYANEQARGLTLIPEPPDTKQPDPANKAPDFQELLTGSLTRQELELVHSLRTADPKARDQAIKTIKLFAQEPSSAGKMDRSMALSVGGEK